MKEHDASLKWCKTHDSAALIYEDGSVSCWWESIVETKVDNHELIEIPRITTLEAALREIEWKYKGQSVAEIARIALTQTEAPDTNITCECPPLDAPRNKADHVYGCPVAPETEGIYICDSGPFKENPND